MTVSDHFDLLYCTSSICFVCDIFGVSLVLRCMVVLFPLERIVDDRLEVCKSRLGR